jgi:hypothetical protein
MFSLKQTLISRSKTAGFELQKGYVSIKEPKTLLKPIGICNICFNVVFAKSYILALTRIWVVVEMI